MTVEPKALEPVLAELVKKIGDAAQHYGPAALDLTTAYLRVEAIVDVGIGIALLVIAGILICIVAKLVRLGIVEGHKDIFEQHEGIIFGSFFGTVLSGALALMCLLFAGGNLLSAATWIALIDPRLALVQIALKAVH